mmetsp:Transcript_2149/g.3090  ORF Transcript_2149/g.3090 Transcript_2149/m.3090 type:complete len:255 (-) Transcript_2149:1560-2324(-)
MKITIVIIGIIVLSDQSECKESSSLVRYRSRMANASSEDSTLSPAPSISPTPSPTNHTLPTFTPTPTPAPSVSTIPTMSPSSNNHSVVPSEPPTPSPSESPIPTTTPTSNHSVVPTQLPTPSPSESPLPTVSPSSNHSVVPTELPTHLPSSAPSRSSSRKKTATGKIIAKSIGWLIVVALSVLLFGAVMSNRYQLYYALRGVWFTILQMDCTRWIMSKLNFRGTRHRSGADGYLNDIVFDENNDLTEGLLMGDT